MRCWASKAVQMGIWVGIATGLYGFSFGALAVAAGLSVPQTCILSLVMFTGGSQFAFIGVISGGGTGLAAWSAASLLGVRNAVYGAQMSALLSPGSSAVSTVNNTDRTAKDTDSTAKGSATRRIPRWMVPIMAQFTIDESMAVSSAQDDPTERRRGFWAAGIGVYVFWNLITLAGAVVGGAVGDPRQWGLDGAAVAAFLGLTWPRLRGRGPWGYAILAAIVTLIATPWLPAGIPILVAAGVGVGLWWYHKTRANRRGVAS